MLNEISAEGQVDDAFAESETSDEAGGRLRVARCAAFRSEHGRDAAAAALAYASEHWYDIQILANPAGYLLRVGRSSQRLAAGTALAHPVDQCRLLHHTTGLTLPTTTYLAGLCAATVVSVLGFTPR